MPTKRGRPFGFRLPRSLRSTIHARLDEGERDEMRIAAEQVNETESEFIRESIRQRCQKMREG